MHPLIEVFNTPSLITELANYTEMRRLDDDADVETAPPSELLNGDLSLLFLRVNAAADYFTTNVKLMKDPPPVDVDLSKPQFESNRQIH